MCIRDRAGGCQTEKGVVEWVTRESLLSTEFRAFSVRVQSVQFPSEFNILRADTAGIVGGKVNGQAIVDGPPLGVMSHGFGRDGAAGHKAESVNEIGKLVLAMMLPV